MACRLFCAPLLAAGRLPCGGGANAADSAVYGDSVAAGWENWSWSTTTHVANTSPVQNGTRSLAVTYTGAWAGLYLATIKPVSTGSYDTLRYNWQTSMINVGSDWYFENLQEGTVNVAALPHGSASDQFVEQDRRTETKTLITVPLIGWTPKSTSPRNHPCDCAFKVSTYGPQQNTDSWDPNCGNGLHADNTPIVGNDPADNSMQIGPAFVTAWINHLTGKYGNAAHGGVAYYNLDNEPMLWSSTHRDVHPLPTSYDELRDRTYQYAAAVKSADPSAKTLGPVLWGWCAYFYSARDGCSNGADYQAHGNTPFVAWYLQQMNAYEQQHGTRILDYLDLHYYPQANGVALSSAGGAATQALRLRSTRSLWDPSYLDESWISDTAPGGVAVYAAQRSIGSALTVIVINKTATSLTSRVNLTGFVPTPTAAVYRYSAASLSAIEHLPDQPLTGREFDATLPAGSITLFILTPGFASPAHATGVGVFRGGAWYVDRDHDQTWEGCSTDGCYTFGMTGDTPVVGDWDGTGTDKIGVYRKSAGVWYLDSNGNGTWHGCGTDRCLSIGMNGDEPLAGKW